MRDSMYEEIDRNEEEFYNDPVNHPSHYNQENIAMIYLIQSLLTPEQFKGYCLGNMLKYELSAPSMENMNQNYDKALWYYNKYKESL